MDFLDSPLIHSFVHRFSDLKISFIYIYIYNIICILQNFVFLSPEPALLLSLFSLLFLLAYKYPDSVFRRKPFPAP